MTFFPQDVHYFQQLQSSSRMELLIQLLQMLNPMEIRFIAVCLEDLARKNGSYAQFRDLEKSANDPNLIRIHFSNLLERDTRSMLTTFLPLVQSTNSVAATEIFKILDNFTSSVLPGISAAYSGELAEEIILLLTLGRHHPAFKFEERKLISDSLLAFQSQERQEVDNCLSPDDPHSCMPPQTGNLEETDSVASSADGTPEVHVEQESTNEPVPSKRLSAASSGEEEDAGGQMGVPSGLLEDEDIGGICPRCRMRHRVDTVSRPSSSATSLSDISHQAYLTGIEVGCSEESQQQKVVGWRQIHLKATWSTGAVTETVKTPGEIYDYHRRLLDLFPKCAGCYGHKRTIPYFPGVQHLEMDGNKVNISLVNKYMLDLKFLPPKILGCQYSCEFFGLSSPVPAAVSPDSDLYLSRLFDEGPENVVQTTESKSVPDIPVREAGQTVPEGVGGNWGSTTTDEDRDLCVKNGTVHEYVFHNSSSKPSRSQKSGPENEEPEKASEAEDQMSESCLSLPANLNRNETENVEKKKLKSVNGVGSSHSLKSETAQSHSFQSFHPRSDYYDHSSQGQSARAYQYGHNGRFTHIANFVPEPLFFALRKRQLLAFKANLSKFSLEELELMTREEFQSKTEIRNPDALEKAWDAVMSARIEHPHYSSKYQDGRNEHPQYNSKYYDGRNGMYLIQRQRPRSFDRREEQSVVRRASENFHGFSGHSGATQYVMSRSGQTSTVPSLGGPLPSEKPTDKEENWDTNTDSGTPSPSEVTMKTSGAGISSKPRHNPSSSKSPREKDARHKNNPSAALNHREDSQVKRGQLPQSSSPKQESLSGGQRKPPPSINKHSSTQSHQNSARGRKAAGPAFRQKGFSDPATEGRAGVLRRANSHNGARTVKMQPGDLGWLESEEEFPSILGKAEEKRETEKAVTETPPSPEPEKSRAFSKQQVPEPETESSHLTSPAVTPPEEVTGSDAAGPLEILSEPQMVRLQRFPNIAHAAGLTMQPILSAPLLTPEIYPPYFPPSVTAPVRSHYLSSPSPFSALIGMRNNPGGAMWPYGNSQFAPGIPLTLPMISNSPGNSRGMGHLPYYPAVPSNFEPKRQFGGGGRISCPNCGRSGHSHQECTEQTFDEITKTGTFNLKIDPDQEDQGEIAVSSDSNTGGISFLQDSEHQKR